jgi:hypothetical protein
MRSGRHGLPLKRPVVSGAGNAPERQADLVDCVVVDCLEEDTLLPH